MKGLKMRPRIKLHVLPGGKLPEQQTAGAIGFDVCIRAILCPHEMDPNAPHLRKTLFDFKSIPESDPKTAQQVCHMETDFVYRMHPHESVLVGIGFITEMEYPMFYWVTPRSGLASRWGITVTNAPGTVDPDYRGEAGVLVYNRNATTFDLRQGMRIAQIIFQRALIPEITEIDSYEDFDSTTRDAGGFGSTGIS